MERMRVIAVGLIVFAVVAAVGAIYAYASVDRYTGTELVGYIEIPVQNSTYGEVYNLSSGLALREIGEVIFEFEDFADTISFSLVARGSMYDVYDNGGAGYLITSFHVREPEVNNHPASEFREMRIVIDVESMPINTDRLDMEHIRNGGLWKDEYKDGKRISSEYLSP